MHKISLRNPRMAGPFNDPAGYDKHTRPFRKLHDRVVADAVAAGLPDEARVLDVGTGPGRIPRAIADRRPEWTVDGVDLDPRMIAYAQERDLARRVGFSVGDVADLPYPDDSFDLIVSSMSQHHWTDVEGAMTSLKRVLRPGGRLWIYDVRFVLRRATRAARISFQDVRTQRIRAIYARLEAC
ncbi:class I SAM-dependent methyltransferase [Actinoplanes sp. NPDC051411]|uniref:class I SAM-dependent methyltransferase n=1 Tax=Actinoplanes sp. NPDC051411 TaxID=3155522 RepID=UPI003439B38F